MIKEDRKNGLKVLAAKEGRSAIKQLDWILRQAGVKELTTAELAQQLKKIEKEEEENLVARK